MPSPRRSLHFALPFPSICFLQHAWTGNCMTLLPPAACSIERRSGWEYLGSVVGNTCSYASLGHLLGLGWSRHSRMDESRIAALACTGSEIPSPVCVCARCGCALARQRDRTACATTVCANRSLAYRCCSLCRVSDLVGLARFNGQVSKCWELLSICRLESRAIGKLTVAISPLHSRSCPTRLVV